MSKAVWLQKEDQHNIKASDHNVIPEKQTKERQFISNLNVLIWLLLRSPGSAQFPDDGTTLIW